MIAPPWLAVPPPNYGGTETVVDRLAVGYQAAGHDVVLFTTGDATCPVPRSWVFETAAATLMGRAMPELHHVLAAYDAVHGFDVVHDHTEVGPLLAADRPTPPVATTVHNPFDAIRRPVYERIADRVAVVAVSNAQRRAAGRMRVAKVIHHGLDPAHFPVGTGDGGYLLFLGRMSPDKGVHRALEAAYKAGSPLVIAAKMRTRHEVDYFDAYVRPYLNDELTFVGEVGGQDKLELLAGARALLNPIRWNEPFGLVMIEALACGTPVLAFPEGAAPEIVEHGRTGLLCHDELDMADAIGRIDTLDRAACRAAVENYFSVDRMVADYLTLFEDLVARRR